MAWGDYVNVEVATGGRAIAVAGVVDGGADTFHVGAVFDPAEDFVKVFGLTGPSGVRGAVAGLPPAREECVGAYY